MKLLLSTCAAIAFVAMGGAAQAQSQQGQAQASPTSNKPLGLTQDAWNAKLRSRGEARTNPGYVRYIYNPANVFPIRTRESMITTIKLPDDEELLQAFAGDDQGFQVGIASPNSIAIKALFPGVDTNLVAYTKDGKIFTFYVRSEGYNSKNLSDFLVDVVMPGQGAMEGGQLTSENQVMQDARYPARAAERVRDPYSSLTPDLRERYREYAEWSDFNPGTVVQDLGVYVPRKEAGGTIPYRVFRDDRFTYVDYGPNATQMTEWPTPLIVVQGVEGPVGFRTAGPGGRMIVMEALGSFVLRNGQRTIVIKPRREVIAGDQTLIEYPVASIGAMKVPTDLPPGRPGVLVSAAKTVVPTNGAPTINGEAPSAVVPLPQTRKVDKKRGGKGSKDVAAAVVAEIPAPAPAAPIRKVVGVGTVPAASDAAMGAALAPAPATTGSVTTGKLQPTLDASRLGTYRVLVGRGSADQVEDRWKSYRVQYFSVLENKTMTPEPLAGGEVAMGIGPITTIAEGMRLCTTLGADGTNCTVKPAKSAR